MLDHQNPTGAVGPDDAAMAEKGAALNPQPEGERPSWLPENFKTPEDLARSYQELQAKFTQQQQPAPQAPAPEAPKAGDAPATGDDEGDDEGVPFEEYIEEALAENGSLTADDYEDLAEAGYTQDMVDRYVAGVQSEVQSVVTAVYDTVGGEQQFESLKGWMAANLTESEASAYNDLVTKGGKEQAVMATQAMFARYSQSNGKDPSLTLNGGGNVSTGSAGAYESWQQVTADMRKPEYRNDPAFQKRVQQKLANSNI